MLKFNDVIMLLMAILPFRAVLKPTSHLPYKLKSQLNLLDDSSSTDINSALSV